MKKLSFVSNLIYALKKRFGWCPEPPTVKTEGMGKFALSKGILYTEKPLSPYFLIGIIFVAIIPIGLILFIWSYPMSIGVRISATLFIGIISLIIWGALTIPSIRHRELSLTEEKLHVRLGPSEETISIYDIISIEPVEKPEIIWGELIGTGYSSAGWMILPFGVALEKSGVKWYVFGGGRTYFKIKRKSGNPVCVGVTNPNEFLEKWRMHKQELLPHKFRNSKSRIRISQRRRMANPESNHMCGKPNVTFTKGSSGSMKATQRFWLMSRSLTYTLLIPFRKKPKGLNFANYG